MDSGFVTTDFRDNGLAAVTFGHPAHNALPSGLLAELTAALRHAGGQAHVRLILLQSAGDRTFCAGASFDELLALEDEEAGTAFFRGVADVINAIRTAPKLVIGRTQGKAVGGGVGFMAACDYCFATKQVAVRLSEVSLNIGPFVIAPALERKIGLAAFTELALNPSRFFDAQWALQKGLVHHLSPSIGAMDDAIRQFCEPLLDKNTEALSALKRTLWRGTEDWDELLARQAAISGRLALSNDAKLLLRKLKK